MTNIETYSNQGDTLFRIAYRAWSERGLDLDRWYRNVAAPSKQLAVKKTPCHDYYRHRDRYHRYLRSHSTHMTNPPFSAIRILRYEGDEAWVRATLAKSLKGTFDLGRGSITAITVTEGD